MKIQYYKKIRWGLAPLAPNDAPRPGPGVDSASNRNDYLELSGGWGGG
jgi:hypothetical protein